MSRSANSSKAAVATSERANTADPTTSRKNVQAQDTPKSALRENLEAIFIAILLALVIRTFVVQAFKIPSGSMKNTLLIGDQILVNKFAYGLTIPYLKLRFFAADSPKRGDIIVFKFPEEPEKDFIKRTIGLPGDTVEIRDKNVFVNGEPYDIPQAIHNDKRIFPGSMQRRDNIAPVTVPENSLFVMGDNRDSSYDSRFWGFVGMDAVKGRAFIIYWSWDTTRTGIRFGRIGDILH